mmetsp:Transcript_39668/g.93971  ORF Transcript_39668/g.93971 Transcript_39668/m.93971 type:complete len:1207 (-) Transcript_39668:191-3811(-)
MHIKFVRIHGFKSYREKTTCGPLSPLHNSVVGYNGSGKSNFFAALRFVLSDSYSNMRPEERAKLLNEGAGATVVNAFVEIVFDNSDHRLDNEKDEVTIKRGIGLKKDEYFIDGKHVTKQDISNMLETAGFSKSNPYYIVEQGKVTKITEMSDKLRLELLKEVAGTNVYEEKKEESQKIMKESDAKMAEIIKNMNMIESRLAKLDKEKEELTQYYSLDKERRSLHHALLSQKIRGLHEDLTGIEREKSELKVDTAENDSQQQVLEAKKQELENQLNAVVKDLQRVEREREELVKEEGDRFKDEYNQQEKVNQLVKSLNVSQKQLQGKAQQIQRLQQEITGARQHIHGFEPTLEAAKREAEVITSRFNEADRQLEVLLSIQSSSQYANKAERDKYLQNEMKTFERTLSARKAESKKAEEDKQRIKDSIKKAEETIAQLKQGMENRKKQREMSAQNQKNFEAKRIDITKEIKELQYQQSQITKNRELAAGECERTLHKIQGAVNQSATRALKFLDKFVRDNNIKGYYGPLIDLFDCNDRYTQAVEQSGGGRLHNAVVEDENVASKLVSALHQSKQGRMQFLPIKKLRPEIPRFPEDASNAQPLISCMKFEDKFKPAMLEVFGKTLLCENIEVASTYRKSHSVACVTIDGDKLAKKGSMRGGYLDTNQSKIKLNKQLKELTGKVQTMQNDEGQIAQKIQELRQQETKIISDLHKAQTDSHAVQQASTTDNRRIENENGRIAQDKEDLTAKEDILRKNAVDMAELEHRLMALQDQLASPFSDSLTPEQEAKMKTLTEQHTLLQKERQAQSYKASDLERQKKAMENSLNNKISQAAELQQEMDSMQDQSGDQDLEVEQLRLQSAKQSAKQCTEQKEAKDVEKNEVKAQKDRVEVELKATKTQLRRQGAEVEGARKKLDQLMDKKNRFMSEMDSAQAQLRELGSLPEAFDKYKDRSQKQLHDELHRVTEKLKTFKDVNKKALDQFNQFTEQREKFRERKEELEKGADSIRELIRKLDEKKDDAIQTTFRMVSKNFADVFEQIVPGGSGELIMKTSDAPREDADEDAGNGAGPSRSIRHYVGVSVKVRFAAGGEVHVMRSLSGGQKSVVALAIIFAIQKCDPAPFYLFDEVDANLDPMYRGAVANMISKQKQGDGESTVQFITSSFQPELVQAADKHWLVTHSGMSRMVVGTLEDQLDIVRKNQQTAAEQQALQ